MQSTQKRKRTEEKEVERVEISTRQMPIEVVAHHIVSVEDSLANREKGQPILFRLVMSNDTQVYAWWPLHKDTAVDVLNTLYVTRVCDGDKEEHRALVENMVSLQSLQLDNLVHREEARDLMVRYFGTHNLGSMKRVYYHDSDSEKEIGEVDFYLLPVKMACYTWLGF